MWTIEQEFGRNQRAHLTSWRWFHFVWFSLYGVLTGPALITWLSIIED